MSDFSSSSFHDDSLSIITPPICWTGGLEIYIVEGIYYIFVLMLPHELQVSFHAQKKKLKILEGPRDPADLHSSALCSRVESG